MNNHFYTTQPDRAFWSRAVAKNFSPSDLIVAREPLIRIGDRVVSAGSCFASNLVPWLERAGIEYVRTEAPHPTLAYLPENLGYRNFSAAYGNIYTARHLRQLLERAVGKFRPREDRWYDDSGHVIDPFRPGLRFPARSDSEYDRLTSQHLEAVQKAFRAATVFVFTLGLTEGWLSSVDGAAFPACPGAIAGKYNPSIHRFHNFTVDEIREDLESFVYELRHLNPGVRLVLTVSPVPLVATATDKHVLTATTYSKAVLRVAAETIAETIPKVTYFPAYEIITGPQAPESFFLANRRDVSEEAVKTVMTALLASHDINNSHFVPAHSESRREWVDAAAELSRRIAEAECDEMLMDA
jgi:hypothetical protein